MLGRSLQVSHADLNTSVEVRLDLILLHIGCKFSQGVNGSLGINCVLFRSGCHFNLVLKRLLESWHNFSVLIQEIRDDIFREISNYSASGFSDNLTRVIKSSHEKISV